MKKGLKKLRIEEGVSQEIMACSLGVSRTTYSAIESGKKSGSIKFWQTLQEQYALNDSEVWQMICE